MKKLLTSLLLAGMVSTANAQMADSATIARIENIELHLEQSHASYRGGTAMVIIGLLINGVAYAVPQKDMRPYMATIGFGAIGIGSLIHMDSHKYLGRIRKPRK